MSATQIRELRSIGFEIGSHTLDHRYLPTLDSQSATLQVQLGKTELEQIIRERVSGFCYPGGKFLKSHVEIVKQAGFTFARTTENLRLDSGIDPYRIPVSLQCYPHPRSVYLRNFARQGQWRLRARMLRALWEADTLLSQLKIGLDLACQSGTVFHLWGHSWELDKFNLWSTLDDFLGYVTERVSPQRRVSNSELVLRLGTEEA